MGRVSESRRTEGKSGVRKIGVISGNQVAGLRKMAISGKGQEEVRGRGERLQTHKVRHLQRSKTAARSVKKRGG